MSEEEQQQQQQQEEEVSPVVEQQEQEQEVSPVEEEHVESQSESNTVDQESNQEPDLEADINKISKHKKAITSEGEESANANASTTTKIPNKKLKRTHTSIEDNNDNKQQQTLDEEDEQTRKKREFEEKFAAILKKPTKKRKNNDVDLESMQDEAISHLKNLMKNAAYMDIDCVNLKKSATNKLKLLPQVKDTLLKSNLYDSILDNNLLEAVRIWLEPLPDGSLPAFEIQKTLFNELCKLPIKTIHLRESGLGKIMLFYQKSKKVDSSLKRIAEKLIGDWTRPIMGRSDNYRAKRVQTAQFDFEKFQTDIKLKQNNLNGNDDKVNRRSLYQESADRRKRAAAPEARTSVYSIAPQVNAASISGSRSNKSGVAALGIGASLSRDERFKKLNQRLNQLSMKKKNVKKGGVSIEGKGLSM
ncbi:hypothetical protein CANARDRAFT_178129 [[Candida] arabinofermentans NRRL YB-2248]|uniref:TFIIS N-terminal domain-containing protein n=1 Tax=[Candida] arabinofermentans NRRL YB-2248 TaxID=983967 RepID=A0A1E4STY9_9ASCO|nr:hypothetical protein CANARDRAFT_178129 [[Candida] arabinofermentans NRRL YB-2248]